MEGLNKWKAVTKPVYIRHVYMYDEWTKVAKGFLSKIQASQQFERG